MWLILAGCPAGRGLAAAVLCAAAACWRPAAADLPVHCLAADVEGSWEFALGPSSAERSGCGHRRPDDPLREPLLAGGRPLAAGPSLAVELLPGGAARLDGEAGSWAVVSDEALEVRVGGREFLAFLGFVPLPADDGGEHLPLSLQKRHSRCNETVVGWYRQLDRSSFGCWAGRRSDGAGGSFLQRRAAAARRGQRQRRLGARRAAEAAVARRAWQPEPVALDWRNVSGKSWVDPPLRQGRCGGCYAIAAAQMLSARRRVVLGDSSAEALSAAFPLFCGEYTQGCQGGFPYLASKWSEDVGVVPERCAPYAEEGTCSLRCDLSELGGRYRATGHRYVAGGEAAIVEELRRSGPLAASFRSDPALMQYSGGVWEPPPAEEEDGAEAGFLAPTHSALLVGFGSDADQGPYWVLQNAWGEEWGERGSFRIGRAAARARGLERFVVAADVAEDERPAVLEAVVGAIAARPATGLEFLALSSRARAGAAARGHRGDPVCQERGQGADDEAIIVRLDADRNFRSLSFGDSAGTETAVQCAGQTPEGCHAVAGEGGSLPDCAALEGCECDLHGQDLPFPGMRAMAERVLLMCSSAAEPVRVLLIGLGGGAISSFLTDRCPPGRLSLENVEKDGRVARLAAQFFGFRPGPESSVEVSDGLAAAKSRPAGAYDAVMVDCFAGADRVPEGCRSREFLAAGRALLRPEGLLLQNAWGRSSAGGAAVEGDFAAMVAAYEAVFGRPPAREVAFDAPDSLEYVLFGLKGQRWASLLPADGEAE